LQKHATISSIFGRWLKCNYLKEARDIILNFGVMCAFHRKHTQLLLVPSGTILWVAADGKFFILLWLFELSNRAEWCHSRQGSNFQHDSWIVFDLKLSSFWIWKSVQRFSPSKSRDFQIFISNIFTTHQRTSIHLRIRIPQLFKNSRLFLQFNLN
jgi:hypothetical protein